MTRKRTAVLAAALVLTGGAAFAYWTTTGSGTGTAATGTVTTVTANQTSVVADMAPGDTAQALSGDFDNPNDGPVYITQVVASIDSVTKAGGAPAGTCDATDYTLASATMTVGDEVDAGTAQGAWTGATLKFNDKAGTNQDGCKGATVHLAYAVS